MHVGLRPSRGFGGMTVLKSPKEWPSGASEDRGPPSSPATNTQGQCLLLGASEILPRDDLNQRFTERGWHPAPLLKPEWEHVTPSQPATHC